MALPSLAATPSHTFKIPSTDKDVTIRPYKVKEEKILLLAAESQDPKTIFESICNVIQECVVKPENFDVNGLTSFDLEYVFLHLRTLSVGETAPVRMKCVDEDCDGEDEINIPLNAVKIDGLDDLKESSVIKLTKDISIEIGYPRLSDLASHEEIFTSPEASAVSYDILKTSIRKVLTKDDVFVFTESTREEQDKFVDELTPQHTAAIAEYLNKIPTVYVDIDFKCPQCGKGGAEKLKGLQDFFS